MKRIAILAAVALSFVAAQSPASAHVLSGSATYYGGTDGFCGKKTASGVRYDCNGMTAAHRTLPFGTVLSVHSGRTGGSVQVTINDRGPFTGAFLDLSPAAARQLGCQCTHHGVTATIVSMGDGATTYTSKRKQEQQPAAFSFFSLFSPEPAATKQKKHRRH